MSTIKDVVKYLQTLDQDKEVISLIFDKDNVSGYIKKEISDEAWDNMIEYIDDHAIEQISGIIVEVHDLVTSDYFLEF